MTFRTRLQLAFALLALLSVGGLALAVRHEMTQRLTDQYSRRVAALVDVIRKDLTREGDAIGKSLRAVARSLSDDNRFRLALLGARPDPSYVLDYAASAMRVAGLAMLQVQDSSGRILTSGHFRNEFDRLEPDLPRLIAGVSGGSVLTHARTAEGEVLSLVRADSARVGPSWLYVVGGRMVDTDFVRRLAPDPELVVTLEPPGERLSSSDSSTQADVVAAELSIPFVSGEAGSRLAEARLTIAHRNTAVTELRRSVTRWSVFAGVLAAAAGVLLATLLSFRLTRPLTELAQQTAALDLTRLDVGFATDRDDEVGQLARLLAAMVDRLRRGAQQLREAERRATIGEVARQVNHDIKNGLVPIRNVLRHLNEVAGRETGKAGELASVFQERKGTLDSSVKYLETLAANYARLSPQVERDIADLRVVIEDVVRGAAADANAVQVDVPPAIPPVRGDPVAVRRILENLIANALDAVRGAGAGQAPPVVTVRAALPGENGAMTVTVSDNGPGMTAEQLDRAFQDFYSTKPGGTGLGLSIVRRLVADLGGSLRVQTEPGIGTQVHVTLPVVPSRGEARS